MITLYPVLCYWLFHLPRRLFLVYSQQLAGMYKHIWNYMKLKLILLIFFDKWWRFASLRKSPDRWICDTITQLLLQIRVTCKIWQYLSILIFNTCLCFSLKFLVCSWWHSRQIKGCYYSLYLLLLQSLQ